ncbi:Uncharacterised protein [Mycobacteroides abscessus subsp. abscessus]|nr:Uncharacterised protein [Mycobacteroides abscessus subsp. abscessus]
MTATNESPVGMTPKSIVSGTQRMRTAKTPTTHWAMTAVPVARSPAMLRKIAPTATMRATATRTGGSQPRSEKTAERPIAVSTMATNTARDSNQVEDFASVVWARSAVIGSPVSSRRSSTIPEGPR